MPEMFLISTHLFSNSCFCKTTGVISSSRVSIKKFFPRIFGFQTLSFLFLHWNFDSPEVPKVFLMSTHLKFQSRVSPKLLIWFSSRSQFETFCFNSKIVARSIDFFPCIWILMDQKCHKCNMESFRFRNSRFSKFTDWFLLSRSQFDAFCFFWNIPLTHWISSMQWNPDGAEMPESVFSLDLPRFSNSFFLALPAWFFDHGVIRWLFIWSSLFLCETIEFFRYIGKSAISADLSRLSNSFLLKTTTLENSIKVWIYSIILLDGCYVEKPAIFFLVLDFW